MKHHRTQLTIIFLAIILVGFLVPLQQAQAFVVESVISITILPPLWAIKEILSVIVGMVARIMKAIIEMPTFVPTPVFDAWEVVRDFTNLFFILVLIIMAFGTIFDIAKYTYKKMFVPFLIAALLINFSMAISTYILDLSKNLTTSIMTSINLKTDGDLWKLISGKGLNPGKAAFTSLAAGISCLVELGTSSNPALGYYFGGACARLASTILVSIWIQLMLLFSYLVVVVFLLIRLPFLWVLLILSPIAWLGIALPGLKKFWTFWRDHFLGWVFWPFLQYGFNEMRSKIIRYVAY